MQPINKPGHVGRAILWALGRNPHYIPTMEMYPAFRDGTDKIHQFWKDNLPYQFSAEAWNNNVRKLEADGLVDLHVHPGARRFIVGVQLTTAGRAWYDSRYATKDGKAEHRKFTKALVKKYEDRPHNKRLGAPRSMKAHEPIPVTEPVRQRTIDAIAEIGTYHDGFYVVTPGEYNPYQQVAYHLGLHYGGISVRVGAMLRSGDTRIIKTMQSRFIASLAVAETDVSPEVHERLTDARWAATSFATLEETWRQEDAAKVAETVETIPAPPDPGDTSLKAAAARYRIAADDARVAAQDAQAEADRLQAIADGLQEIIAEQ